MGQRFLRCAKLTIARPQSSAFDAAFFPNAVVVTDLRITFKVDKSLKEEPNACEVMVYNLSPGTRTELQEKNLHITLEAGYNNEYELIFAGNLSFQQSSQEGTSDWCTKLEVGDGLRAYQHARLNKSYKAGTSRGAVVKDLAGAMGLKAPKSLDDLTEMGEQFASGFSVKGSARNDMTKVLKARGVGWSIQDGRLQILKEDAATGETALVISQDTGMMGSPEFGTAPKKGGPRPVKIQHTLYPSIRPGRKIQVESLEIKKALFRVEKVTHEGDTHGAQWTTTIEATPL